MMDQKRKPISVGILLIDGFALMSYAGIIEPMRAANLGMGETVYEISHLAVADFAKSSSGAMIPTQKLEDLEPGQTGLDRLFVVAGGDPFAFENRDVLAWLRRAGRSDLEIAGVSGGPVILAMAGLLDGYHLTVHWEHADLLSRRFPDLQIKRTLFVMDRNRVTCAGGTAPLDLMYAWISIDCGEKFAREVSDWFLHTEIRPPIGPQKSGLIERYGTHNRAVLQAIEAMETHIADTLSQSELTHFSGVSERQLHRLFVNEMGVAPMSFYRDLRLDHAAKLLEQSTMSITQITFATGFSSTSHFSTKFAKKFGMNPRQYQKESEALS